MQVSRVDLDGRKIDFRWVQDDVADGTAAVTRKSKPQPEAGKISGKTVASGAKKTTDSKRGSKKPFGKAAKKSPTALHTTKKSAKKRA